jgi:predicted anti-sigma-YlaC factor YlaD
MSRNIFFVLVIALLASGCSIKRYAINKVADSLAGGGTTFASDDDPQLIADAAPFSLKLMETLLAETPRHEGLLLALASGFTQYSYAFVQQEAERLEDEDLAKADVQRVRARRMYLRARNYGLRGMETKYKQFGDALRRDARAAVRQTGVEDVPLLYWTGVSWAGAISASKDNPELISDLPIAEALVDRAFELDEDWNDGAIHSFLITYEMSRTGAAGDPAARARKHFDRAVELSGGKHAGPFVTYAEAVAVQQQDRAQFEKLLQHALAIDPDAQPESRLFNLVAQQRARWLLSRIDDLFFEAKK